jgi:hypothetical protein
MKVVGQVHVSPGRIVVNLPMDFARYYQRLIYWRFPNLIGGLFLPKHGPHITIGQPKIHTINQKKAWTWNKTTIEVDYDPTSIYIGGFKKGFVGFYVKAHSLLLDKIKKDVILEEVGDSSFHISICNSKHYLLKQA